MLIAQIAPDMLNVTQFGVAGLMGALWWWERRYSRQREDQLTQAHDKILQQREHLHVLLEALEGNTRVILEFTAVQQEIIRALREHGIFSHGAESRIPHASATSDSPA